MTYIYLLKFLGVMISVAIADICWVHYFIKVEERKAVIAGWWSVGIIGLGAISVEGYVHDPTLIIAAMIGAFIGTYITIKFNMHKKKGDE